jgi:hypothetical protein
MTVKTFVYGRESHAEVDKVNPFIFCVSFEAPMKFQK